MLHAARQLPSWLIFDVSQKSACPELVARYRSTMSLTSIYLAEEALSLPPEQRQQLANLLLDSLKTDGPTDEELRAMLRSRLADLESGKDAGMSFEEVFGEKA
jgi:putative addiction module component (TIGR02574 family)